MKKMILVIGFIFATSFSFAAETERVCVKDSKGKETCKTIKVHKKLEGTQVPDSVKKK